jgi:hypothetical protein
MDDLPAAMGMGEEVEDEFSFNVPQNFTPPEGYEEGKPFDMVASLVMSNGRLKINSLNGAKLAAEEAEDEATVENEEDELEEEAPMAEDGGASLMNALSSLK